MGLGERQRSWLGDLLITSAVARGGKGRFGKAEVTATVEGMVVADEIATYGWSRLVR